MGSSTRAICILTLFAIALSGSAAAQNYGIDIVDKTLSGQQTTTGITGFYSRISGNGRYVVFKSSARDILPNIPTNTGAHIFLRDLLLGRTKLVSANPTSGQVGTATSHSLSVSQDGRFVAFLSDAPNLVIGDTNGFTDVFIYDHVDTKLERVNISSEGAQANKNPPDFRENEAGVSADGRYVVFTSAATNLVPSDTNGVTDIFIRDRVNKTTTRIVGSNGTQGDFQSNYPDISADGRYVAFESNATLVPQDTDEGKVDIYLYDRIANSIEPATPDYGWFARISSDGNFISYASASRFTVENDTNGKQDIFVYNRQTHTTELVSVSSMGVQANGHSYSSALSSNGRYVVFSSEATNLVEGDTDGRINLFVHDRIEHTTKRFDLSATGQQPTSESSSPDISGDGSLAVFASSNSDLIPNQNTTPHIFIAALKPDGLPSTATPTPTSVPSTTPTPTATMTPTITPTVTNTPITGPTRTATPIPSATATPQTVLQMTPQPDQKSPVVTLTKQKANVGKAVNLAYSVSDDSGILREAFQLLKGKKVLASVQRSVQLAAGVLRRTVKLALKKPLPGTYTFCVVVTDTYGNMSERTCAPVKIAAKKT